MRNRQKINFSFSSILNNTKIRELLLGWRAEREEGEGGGSKHYIFLKKSFPLLFSEGLGGLKKNKFFLR